MTSHLNKAIMVEKEKEKEKERERKGTDKIQDEKRIFGGERKWN